MPRFEAHEALRLIARHSVTSFIAVPTMLQDLLAAAPLQLCFPSVRKVLVGAGGTPPSLQVCPLVCACVSADAASPRLPHDTTSWP